MVTQLLINFFVHQIKSYKFITQLFNLSFLDTIWLTTKTFEIDIIVFLTLNIYTLHEFRRDSKKSISQHLHIV